MKPLFFFLLFTIAVFGPVYGQVGQGTAAENESNLQQILQLNPLSAGARAFDNRYEGVKGSPFLFKDFYQAEVLLRGNKTSSKDVEANLDVQKNLLAVRLKNGMTGGIPASRVDRLTVGQADTARSFLVLPAKLVEGGSSADEKFYEVLHEGKFLLLKGFTKIFQKANYQGAYSQDRPYDQYLDQERFYLRLPDGTFSETPKLRPKTIEKMLDAYAGVVKKTVDTQKLDLYQLQDFIALLRALEEQVH